MTPFHDTFHDVLYDTLFVMPFLAALLSGDAERGRAGKGKQQIPPLRFASVGMTLRFGGRGQRTYGSNSETPTVKAVGVSSHPLVCAIYFLPRTASFA